MAYQIAVVISCFAAAAVFHLARVSGASRKQTLGALVITGVVAGLALEIFF